MCFPPIKDEETYYKIHKHARKHAFVYVRKHACNKKSSMQPPLAALVPQFTILT